MEREWESQLAGLFNDLSDVQGELLTLLSDKSRILAAGEENALGALQMRQEQLLARLQGCHDRRAQLLDRAGQEGLPSDSLQSLAAALPEGRQQGEIEGQLRESALRTRLLQHHSLTNWVLVQRTLLHLSQMLEILATGGRGTPTYGEGAHALATGGLMDQEA